MNPIVAFVDVLKANQKKGMVVAEIGTYDGSTTRAYIDIIKQNEGHLYVVDWFKGNEGADGLHTYNESEKDNVLTVFKTAIKGYEDIVTILDGKSEDMITEIPDNSLDICFIDADHRYAFVSKDIKMCLKKMKPDGIICGHDLEDLSRANTFSQEDLEKDSINGLHCGVIQAVYDHFGNDVQVIQDPNGQRVPIWVKQL